MEEDKLISKKDLLQKYNISYGALYRWKRKGLIPEDWFIKKSTSTGQETFLPKELICQRVELILETKEEILLDQLARKLNHLNEKSAYLCLLTVFGEKKYNIKDVKEIVIVNAQGKYINITNEINKILKEEN